MPFCQVCRHEEPTHESWCPVLTGVAIPGNSQDMIAMEMQRGSAMQMGSNQMQQAGINLQQMAHGSAQQSVLNQMAQAGINLQDMQPFPGSSADFYERNLVLQAQLAEARAEIALLKKELGRS